MVREASGELIVADLSNTTEAGITDAVVACRAEDSVKSDTWYAGNKLVKSRQAGKST